MSKRWTQAILGVTIIGIFFGWIRHVDAQAEQDAQLLLNVAKPFIQSDYKVTFKYTGYFGTCDGLDTKIMAAGASLSNKLDFPQTSGHTVPLTNSIYTIKSDIEPGAVMSLTVASPPGQSACYAVLRLDAAGNVDQDHLLKFQEQTNGLLKAQGIKGTWNVMIQGYVSSEAFDLTNNPADITNELVSAYKGHVVESYEDPNTVSTSIASSGFEAFIKSGGQKINVQIALHKESTSGLWRLTVGTPIITMEY